MCRGGTDTRGTEIGGRGGEGRVAAGTEAGLLIQTGPVE